MIDCDKRVTLAADADIQENDKELARLDFKLKDIAPNLDDKATNEALTSAALETCAEFGIGTDGKMDSDSITTNIKEAIKSNLAGVRESLLKNYEKEVETIEKVSQVKEKILEIANSWLESTGRGTLPDQTALNQALDDSIALLEIDLNQNIEAILERLETNPRDTAKTLLLRYRAREQK